MSHHRRLTAILSVALTLANAVVPAWADDRAYYRHRVEQGGLANGTTPDPQDNSVRGTGELAVFGPVQVRARPGVPFTLRFPVAQATDPVTWTSQGVALPDGLSLDPSGTIVGSPTAVGEARGVAIAAKDATGRSGVTQPFTITVAPLPVVSLASAFTFPAGRTANIAPSASNLYGSRTWTLQGTLPIGLSLDPVTGAITGSADQKGTFPGLRVGVTDSDGAQAFSAPFTISVETDLNLYGLQAAYAARLGKALRTVRPYLTGTTNPVSWSLISSDGGALPPGLAIDASTGALSGTPTAGGTYHGLSARALDTVTGDRIASAPFTLTVAGAPTATAGSSYFGRVGQSLLVQPAATNVLGGARWMLDGGDLPGGLTLNPDSGRISGTLATTGAGGDLSLRVIDLLDGSSASTQPFAIQSWPKLDVQAAGIPLAQVGRAFRMAAPTVQGLRGAMSLTLSGTLPSGLSFDRNTGEIAGVPDKAGPSGLLAYGVTDAGDDMSAASPAFSLDVLAADVPVPFAVTGIPSTLQAKAGQQFDYQPSATGANGTVTWTLGGAVPAWLGVAPATGRLTGTPTAAGRWDGFSYTARDATTGKTAPSNAFAISVAPADLLSIRLSPSYSTQVGTPASDVRPDIQNASGATTFALASGTLPPGTQIDAATGTLTGNTTESGSFAGLVMSVADASGARSTSNAFTVSVLPAPASANAATASLTPGQAALGAPYVATPTSSGLASPRTWSVAAGTLPGWASLDPSSGTLSGTPDATGVTTGLSLRVADQTGKAARTSAFTLSVIENPPFSADVAPSYQGSTDAFLSVTATSTGGKGATTWSVASGNLPQGLALSAPSGTIQGVPAQTGTTSLSLMATDATGAVAFTPAFSFVIGPGVPLQASLASPLQGIVGRAFTATPAIKGAKGATSWALAAGTLPPGLTLDAGTGRLWGIPTTEGTSAGLVLSVGDASGARASTPAFAVSVAAGGLRISGIPSSLGGNVNAAFASPQPVVTDADGAVGFALASGTLPPGMSLSAATGVISGSPSAQGTTPGFTLRATDASGRTAVSDPFSIVVGRPGLIAKGPTGRQPLRIGLPASLAAPSMAGALGSVSWSVAGSLPAGLAVSSATGAISGTPTAPGGFDGLALVGRDASDGASASTTPFAIDVLPAPSVFVASSYGGRQSSPFTMRPTATDTVGALAWTLASGPLPPWATLDAATGEISGSPALAATYPGISLTVRDASGLTATSQPFSIVVDTWFIASTSTNAYTGRVGMAFSTGAPNVRGGSGGVTWTVLSGTPPTWATLDAATGTLRGTPTAAGTTTLSLRATDASGVVADTSAFSISVTPAPSVTMASVAGRAGAPLDASPSAPNAKGPLSWTLSSGTLPGWASLDLSSGRIYGASATKGVTPGLVLTMVDADGAQASSPPFSLTIADGIAVTGLSDNYAGRMGQPLSASIAPSASGAKGTVRWALVGGAGQGLSISATTGIVSGTPLQAGVRTLTVEATDGFDGAKARASFTVTVGQALQVTGTPGLSTHVNVAGASMVLGVIGQRGTVSWSVTGGTLPTWATLDTATGMIRGTPTTVSSVTGLYLQALDSVDSVKALSTSFSVEALPAPAVVNMATNYTARFGFPFTATAPTLLNAGGTVTWAWADGVKAPAWLALNASTGVMTGTADVLANVPNLMVKGSDTAGGTANSIPFTVNVYSQPSVTASASSIRGRVGDTASVTAKATGMVGAASWSLNVVSGTAPAGLKVDPATGTLSGPFTGPGTASVTIRVTDAADGTSVDSAPISVVVQPALSLAGIKTEYRSRTNVFLSTDVPSPTGAQGNVSYGLSIAAPAGMTFKDGVLSGVPTATVTSQTVTLTMSDPYDGRTASAVFVLNIQPPMTASGATSFSVHSEGDISRPSFAPVASNALGKVTWALKAGTLPNGVSVDPATGKLVGIPTGYATATAFAGLRLEAADIDKALSSTAAFTVTVNPPLVANVTPTNVSVRIGDAVTVAPTATGITGTATWTYTLLSGTLPTGLSWTAPKITGTVTGAGLATVRFTVTDSSDNAAADTQVVTVSSATALSVATPNTQTLRKGTAFTMATPAVSGAKGTVTWSTTSSVPGLSLDTTTGVLSGTPTAQGTTSFVIKATDTTDNRSVSTNAFSVAVSPTLAPVALTATDYTLRKGQNTTFYPLASTGSSVTGNQAPNVSWAWNGPVPTGTNVTYFQYNSVNYPYLYNPPTANGVFTGLTLTVTDPYDGATATTPPFNVTVVTLSNPTSVYLRKGGSENIPAPVASGFPATPTWALASGALPAGMSLDASTGVVSGSPTTATSYAYALRATSGAISAVADAIQVTVSATLAPVALTATDYTLRKGQNTTFYPLSSTGSSVTGNQAPNVTWTWNGTVPAGTNKAYYQYNSVNYPYLSGPPSANGTWTGLTLTVTDPYDGRTATTPAFNVTVVDLVTSTPVYLRKGASESIPAPLASGFPSTPTWTLASGALPAGMTLNASTGVVSGSPTTATSYAYALRATSGVVSAVADAVQVAVSATLAPVALTATDYTLRKGQNTTFYPLSSTGSSVTGNQVPNVTWAWNGPVPTGTNVTYFQYNAVNYPYLYNAPTANGVFTGLTLTVTDPYDGRTATTPAFNITVVTLSNPTSVYLRKGASESIPAPVASGFPGTPTWSLGSGALPPGMTLDAASGIVSGSPTTASSYAYALRATSGAVSAVADAVQVTVSASLAPVALTATDYTLRKGQSVNLFPLTSTGSSVTGNQAPNVTWAWNGPVPTGTNVTYYQYNAVNYPYLYNAPTANGVFTGLTLTVTDPYDGRTATTPPFNVTVVTLSNPTSVYLRKGTNETIPAPTASGFPSTPTWSLGTGALPPGMTLDASTGVVSGSPTTATSYAYALRATSGVVSALTDAFQVTVSATLAPVPLTATDYTLRKGQNAALYPLTSAGSSVTGNQVPNVSWAWNGPVPTGTNVTYYQYNAVNYPYLYNVPTATGTYAGLTLTVTDPYDGRTATTPAFNVTVVDLVNPAVPPLRKGTNATLSAPTTAGFASAPTWTLGSGTVPAGMTLDAAIGTLAGTPTTAGTYTYTLRATSGAVTALTDTFTVIVSPTLAVNAMPSTDVTLRKGVGSSVLLPNNTVGMTGNVSGYASMVWSYNGTVPAGMTFNSVSVSNTTYAYLSGNPSGTGSYPAQTFSVTDPYDNKKATSAPFNLTVVDLVSPAQQNISGSTTTTALGPTTGGFPDTPTWTLANGTIPAGMTLSASAGTVSGKPTATAVTTYTYTLRATSGTVSAVSDAIVVRVTP